MPSLRTDKLSWFQLANRSILRDEPGYLVNTDDWDEEVCRIIAAEEEIVLNDDHWAIVHFMRAFQEQRGISPDARFVFSFLAEQKQLSKKEARDLFFELFPYGYVQQACKIAGMLQPRAWSTG